MSRKSKIIGMICILLVMVLCVAGIGLSQGTSPLKIELITVTPSTFKPGNTLHFTVAVKNPTSKATYSNFTVYFQVAEDGATKFIGITNCPKLNAGEKRTINIAQTYTVTGAFNKLAFIFTPIDPPHEFGTQFQIVFVKSCSYSKQLQLAPLKPIKMNLIK